MSWGRARNELKTTLESAYEFDLLIAHLLLANFHFNVNYKIILDKILLRPSEFWTGNLLLFRLFLSLFWQDLGYKHSHYRQNTYGLQKNYN
jgi:hypothetical protein